MHEHRTALEATVATMCGGASRGGHHHPGERGAGPRRRNAYVGAVLGLLTVLLVPATVAGVLAQPVCRSPLPPATSSFSGFVNDVPQPPYDRWYQFYYRNLDRSLPCTTFAQISVGHSPTAEHPGDDASATLRGCVPPTSATVTHTLVPLFTSVIHNMSTDCAAGRTDDARRVLDEALATLTAGSAASVTPHHLGLVLGGELDANPQHATLHLNVSCVLETILLWQAGSGATGGASAASRVSAVFFRDEDVAVTPGRSDGVTAALDLPEEVLQRYPFAVVLYRTSTMGKAMAADADAACSSPGPATEWAVIRDGAWFNHQRWTRGMAHPQRVAQTRAEMTVALAPETAASCFRNDTLTCVPLGGKSIWATTSPTPWYWDGTTFTKTTKPGSIAVFIASTSVAMVHDAVPGADGAASGIVAALGAAEALRRRLALTEATEQCADVDVSFFFVPGEHLGHVGSGRLVWDTLHFTCHAFGASSSGGEGGKEACLHPRYRTLNFTTIDFTQYAHFIAVDQVGLESADLFYHVDSRVTAGSGKEQATVEAWLTAEGIQRAATESLPFSPITTLLDLLPATMPESASFVTLARYNTTYVNTRVFTARDTPDALSSDAVASAADVIYRLAMKQMECKNPTASPVSINRTLVAEWWRCFASDFGCAALRCQLDANRFVAPNYFPSVFDDSVIAASQVLIERALEAAGWTAQQAPAFAPAIQLSDSWHSFDWDGVWGERSNSTDVHTYDVYAESFWQSDTGVRTALVDSSVSSYVTLGVAVVLNVAVGVAVAWARPLWTT